MNKFIFIFVILSVILNSCQNKTENYLANVAEKNSQKLNEEFISMDSFDNLIYFIEEKEVKNKFINSSNFFLFQKNGYHFHLMKVVFIST